MAIRDIVKDGEPILRKKCREVDVFDDKLAKLLDDMKDTLHKADGVGLAAPQVGMLKRAVIVEFEDFFLEMVNPVIVEQSGSQIGQEACLSVPNRSCDVKRPNRLTCVYQTRKGEKKKITVEDFIARIFCHEIDHLDGILYYDKEYKDKK